MHINLDSKNLIKTLSLRSRSHINLHLTKFINKLNIHVYKFYPQKNNLLSTFYIISYKMALYTCTHMIRNKCLVYICTTECIYKVVKYTEIHGITHRECIQC